MNQKKFEVRRIKTTGFRGERAREIKFETLKSFLDRGGVINLRKLRKTSLPTNLACPAFAQENSYTSNAA